MKSVAILTLALLQVHFAALVPVATNSANNGKVDYTCTKNGVFAVPRACTGSYFVCLHGVLHVKKCYGSAIFDPALLRCVPFQRATCLEITTELPSTTPLTTTPLTTFPTCPPKATTTPMTTIAPFKCPEDGKFIHPTDCTSYYHCTNGVASIQQCPFEFAFNGAIRECDWPFNVPQCAAQRKPSEVPEKSSGVEYTDESDSLPRFTCT